MSTILENLVKYFQNNSRAEIDKDWADSEKYDQIGPKISDFLEQSKLFYVIEPQDSYWEFNCLNNIIKNPEFSSDFFYFSI
ncbi:hypothetical protein [Cecembia rubra]|uniref:Uncharacterized protein n=1 Tax=Cecembia rubra TaxID=1485585 RepID=A0A2P8DM51_9BACT|nr:hypothetical protein [Cecembia rubra]PSK98323.1 hypothetical protein CLV48_11922 [Cecembia rubra]